MKPTRAPLAPLVAVVRDISTDPQFVREVLACGHQFIDLRTSARGAYRRRCHHCQLGTPVNE